MSLEPVTDHVERGLSRLIEQYKGKPRIASLLTSYLRQVQELSDAAWGVLVSRLIDNAVGEQLTVLSRLVGEPRRLEDDERQRVIVRARIAVNRSHGKLDELIRIGHLLFDGVGFYIAELPPATMILVVLDPATTVPDVEFEMLTQARAAGVRLDIHFSEDDPSTWFNFDTGPGWDEGVWIGALSEHTR